MRLTRALVEREVRAALTAAGRPPAGDVAVRASDMWRDAIIGELTRRDAKEVTVDQLARALAQCLREGDGRGYPAVADVMSALGVAGGPKQDSLDDAPVAEDCSRGCRRGLLEWIEPPRGSRQVQADGPRVSTACVCASGRWVRARDYLRVSAMDPDECLRRGYVPADTFSPMPVLLPEDVRWIHERADSMRPGQGQSYDGLQKMGGGRVAEAYREWVDRNVPRQWR